ncbi:DUF4554 domain-containing protein [Lampris incognitus]|uniref:DUF4554 domain-containing protein n=1 Tax=Lampris incognitus TaxID=2546036 RepID=UPI0024B5EE45|nr:DUF4554 domain-containing protein [Lampris incognitus]
MIDLQPELHQKLYPSNGCYPEPDSEELCGFVDMYGPLCFFVSLPLREKRLFNLDWRSNIEAFLQRLSLTNGGVKIHLRFKADHKTTQHIFRSSSCIRKEGWCQGGHPVLGGRLPLSIPPEVMDRGLYGDLSLQSLTLLRPCVLEYPNLTTRLTEIQISFTEYCQELGLGGLRCSTSTGRQQPHLDCVYSGVTLYTVENENSEQPQPGWSLDSVEQSLVVFLFLQHSDPFTSQLSDVMTNEELLELNLEMILDNNKQAVMTALQTDLKTALKAQRQRTEAQKTICSATAVILSSALSVVSSSSNMNFRTACVENMRVHDTHELAASLQEALRRVTSWKFAPKGKCYPDQMDTPPDSNEPTRGDI